MCSSSSTPLSYPTVSTTLSHINLSSPHLFITHFTSTSVALIVKSTSFRTFLSIYCSGFHCFVLIFIVSIKCSIYLSIFYSPSCTFISPTITNLIVTLVVIISFTLTISITSIL